jgi:hypothetical protein
LISLFGETAKKESTKTLTTALDEVNACLGMEG